MDSSTPLDLIFYALACVASFSIVAAVVRFTKMVRQLKARSRVQCGPAWDVRVSGHPSAASFRARISDARFAQIRLEVLKNPYVHLARMRVAVASGAELGKWIVRWVPIATFWSALLVMLAFPDTGSRLIRLSISSGEDLRIAVQTFASFLFVVIVAAVPIIATMRGGLVNVYDIETAKRILSEVRCASATDVVLSMPTGDFVQIGCMSNIPRQQRNLAKQWEREHQPSEY